ncbi:MAG: hypothetical protein E7581_05035 [Ruminococcaceae bacterium]|nr:hypothetical protein [Oscillospiraceae bacterium]
MKKHVSVILLLAILLCSLVCCAQNEENELDTSAGQETEQAACLDQVPDSLDYGGEDVAILNRALQGWTWDEVAVPELNSEPVNDAVFNRNLKVEDRLNIKINSIANEDPDPTVVVLEARNAVLAGSDEYDLLAGACCMVLYTVLEGTFRDISHLEYLDLSQDYWTQDYNDVMMYGDRQYSATGAIALSTYRFAFVTMFNKQHFDDKGVPYLYEAVANDEWTLDYQAALSKDFYQDLNGNSKKDEDDFYGLITSSNISTDSYWAACDVPLVEKNADGEYEYVLDVAKLSDVTDKILRLCYESGTLVYRYTPMDGDQDDIRIAFSKGKGAMATTRLVAVEQVDIRSMTDPYGIVPMPKYDVAQKHYGTLQHDQFTVYAIPKTVNDSTFQMLGATLEVMASESARIVKPAYYELALKRKYMSDPIAWDMLDLIFESIRIDAGIEYTAVLGTPTEYLRQIVDSKINTVSSQYAKLERTFKKDLLKMQDQLDDLEE